MSLRLAISTVRGSRHRVVRRYSDHSQTDLLNYQAPAAALFGKGSFGTLANMRAGGPATMPGVRHRCDILSKQCFPSKPLCLIKDSRLLLVPGVL